MAEVALVLVIRKAVDVAGNLIVEEGSRLYWLREEILWLESQLRHMQAYTAVAEANQDTDPRVVNLIKDIRDLAFDVDDILDDLVPKVKSYRSRGVVKKTASIIPYWLTCSKLAQKIKKIRRRVEAIDADRKTYNIQDTAAVSIDRINVDPRVAALHVDEPVVVGLGKDIADLKRKLLSNEEGVLFVAIVGMPGVGKSTLAKEVYKSVKDHFGCSAWAYVSEKPNFTELLQSIAKQVGLPKDKQEENSEADLYAFLKKKRYVLLLDDIWNKESWDKLKAGIPINCDNRCRIIITSRDTGVGRYIGGHENSLHHLKPYDFPTSWNLFNKLIMASLNTGDNQGSFENSTLGNIGKEIVERCGGVPLAIVVIVGLLRAEGTSEVAWNRVLQNIGKDSHDKCSEIFKLSYSNLPSELKPCFLYLGIFPEDYEICASELIKLWITEKFIQHQNDFEPEDVGEDYLSKLVARNLVQVVSRKFDGRIKCIRIHDLVHTLCTRISKEINFFHTIIDEPNPPPITRALRISIHHNKNIDITLNNQNLKVRTLLFFNSRQQITEHGKQELHNKRLQVLSMNNLSPYWSHQFNIKNLRRLSYIRNFFRGVSSIQIVKNLQSLDLRGVYSRTHVPMAIWTMKQLRHFLLNNYVRVETPDARSRVDNLREMIFPPNHISLPNLQTLHGILSSDVKFFRENTCPNLKKFKVWDMTSHIIWQLCGPVPILAKLETLGFLGGKLKHLRELNLSQYKELKKLEVQFMGTLPQLHEFPPNLLKLTLCENYLDDDPMQVLKKLPKLKILVLGWKSYRGRSLDCSGSDGFPQLQLLHLKGLPDLEEITDGEERGMHELREFKADYCDKFDRAPSWLQKLRVKN